MKREQLTTVLLLAATAAMAYVCYLMVSPFLMPIFGAGILVILFQPLHARISIVVRSPGLSALLSTLVVVILIILPLMLVGGLIGRELRHFYKEARLTAQAQAQTESDSIDEEADTGSGFSWLIDSVSQQVSHVTHVDETRVHHFLSSHMSQGYEYLAGHTTGFLRNASVTLFHIILSLFTMFFLFKDRKSIMAKLEQLLPLKQEDSQEVFTQSRDLIVGTIYGTGAVALMQGILDGLAFWVLGVPSAMLWGIVIVFFAFIPVVGSAIIWVPIAIILAAQGHIWKAVFLVVFIGGVVGSLDHVVKPLLIGRHTRLHTLAIFFSVLGGIAVFGPLGVVMGPVAVAITMSLVEVLRREFNQKRPVEAP
jgi:predicted PurR-regulated permease PerM